MGQEVERREFTREDRQRYRAKVHRCLDVLAQMLSRSSFDFERPHVGLEIELNLVDEDCDPAMRNAEVLDLIADEVFQTELGQFNLEINMRPVRLIEQGLTAFEAGLRESLNDAEAKARSIGAHLVIVGILPSASTRCPPTPATS